MTTTTTVDRVDTVTFTVTSNSLRELSFPLIWAVSRPDLGNITSASGPSAVYVRGQLPRFGEKIREGNDLVMGSRMTGRIEKDAMPWLHRYIGNPALSGILRVLFNVKEVLTARAGRESAIFLGISAHPADRPKWPGMQSRSESGPRVVLTETGRSVCPF